MPTGKKKKTSGPARKLKDLKARKNPKGGATQPSVGVPLVVPKKPAPAEGWIEIDSFSFGASNP
jgi:hypothetical protein